MIRPTETLTQSDLTATFNPQAIANSYSTLDSSSTTLYYFTYYYNPSSTSSDYYGGYLYAPTDQYSVGSYYDFNGSNNEAGYNGQYYITSASSLSDSYSTFQGLVYVYSYYDADSSQKFYDPYYYSLGNASGTNYLGSEFDYVVNDLKNFGQLGTGYDYFGNDYYETDLSNSTTLYSFTYYYNPGSTNSDYYTGSLYAPTGNYTVGSYYDFNGSNNEAGYNGKYYITSAQLLSDSYSTNKGLVYIYSYYDADSSQRSYIPYFYSIGDASGTNYLGSEVDYAVNDLRNFGQQGTGYDSFGNDYYEADLSNSTTLYYFTYYYNGSSTTKDYYSGYIVAPTGNYTIGSYYDYNPSNNEVGYNGQYYITSAQILSDSYSSYKGLVYVYSYYDADSSKQFYQPYYYSLGYASGNNYFGSEFDYIVAGSRYDYFKEDYYEADL